MTLLLGPPSSGKTTLLSALAGKLDKDLKLSGKVRYNGHETKEFVPAERSSDYIRQYGLHMGEQTVRETLSFSGRVESVGPLYETLMELLRKEKEANIEHDPDIDLFMKASALEGQEANVITDYILKILGLEVCADNMDGDEMIRGISGGLRKRLTTGRALFMDEISVGLDRSKTFQIVNSIKQSIHILQGTGVISLLQPAPETYELFDDIILLSNSYIVYQGPVENVLEFFQYMGFKCPERKGAADFLLEVTSKKDQEQYRENRDEPYNFVTAKEFSEAFRSFHVGQRRDEELHVPFNVSKGHPAALTTRKYGVSKKKLLMACASRELLPTKKNTFVYMSKMTQLALIAFITMTVFLRTEMHKKTMTYTVIFFGALIIILFNGLLKSVRKLHDEVTTLRDQIKQKDEVLASHIVSAEKAKIYVENLMASLQQERTKHKAALQNSILEYKASPRFRDEVQLVSGALLVYGYTIGVDSAKPADFDVNSLSYPELYQPGKDQESEKRFNDLAAGIDIVTKYN